MSRRSSRFQTIWIAIGCLICMLPSRLSAQESATTDDPLQFEFTPEYFADRYPIANFANESYWQPHTSFLQRPAGDMEEPSRGEIIPERADWSVPPEMADWSLTDRYEPAPGEPLFTDIGNDFKAFYNSDTLLLYSGLLVAGGAMANSSVDRSMRDFLDDNLANTPSDEYAEFAHEHRLLGDGYMLIPAYALVGWAGKNLSEDPVVNQVGEWSERSMRAIVVATPTLLIGQFVTGGSRPGETDHGSSWRPFQDNNGISGHAFMGAIPLLTAARMTDSKPLKYSLIAASTIPGLSRITDDAHYPSQVLLGWSLAFLATAAVDSVENPKRRFQVSPLATPEIVGIQISFRR